MKNAQHPFTPEPREPEPWPGPRPVPSGWVWDSEPGESITTDSGHAVLFLDADDRKALAADERKRRKRYRERGWSIGFGSCDA